MGGGVATCGIRAVVSGALTRGCNGAAGVAVVLSPYKSAAEYHSSGVDFSDRSRFRVVVGCSEAGTVNVCGGGVRAGGDEARDAGRSVSSGDLGSEVWAIALSADSDFP